MNRILILLWIPLLVSCGRKEPGKPNILIIMADDLGWNQLGCYGGPYHTPHIDALAATGMRFTNAYSSAAVCSPTRAALMTGKYPARLHLTDFIKGGNFPDSMLVQPQWHTYLPLEEITLAEVFRENGYRTAIFGKWHLSQDKKPPASEPYNPDKQGFDEFMVTYKPVAGITDPEGDPHNVDSITDRSIRFLEKHGNHLFFLVVAHNAIHDPAIESRSRINRYQQTIPDPGYHVEPVIGAMINRLDKGTGRLLEKLEELGLEENTIILFCSDNGGKEAYADQKPFRKGKGWLYEGGIRVPLVARWPGRIDPGTISAAITSTMDIYPTMMELAGLPRVEHPLDGISLAPELLVEESLEKETPGKETLVEEKLQERMLCWHYPHYHRGSGMKPASAIRIGRYKLIEWHEGYLSGEQAWELYDLETDPGEQHDLSGEQPERLESMIKELHQWRNETGAQMPSLKE